jgi:hypothetical protein
MTPQNEFLEDIYHSCVLRAQSEIQAENKSSLLTGTLIRIRARRYFEEHKQQLNQGIGL